MDNLNSANIISNSSKSTVVGPGEYALISLPYQFLWATDLPEIYNPDGLLISESSVHGEGLTTVTCQSWISDNGVDWSVAAYPTPGAENVVSSDFATAGDILLTRVSPYQNEFIQLKNIGQNDAYLMDWQISINDGLIYECNIDSTMFFPSMSSIIISDSNAMNSFTGQDMTFIDEENPVFLQFSYCL